MTYDEQVNNWLEIAFTRPRNSLTEYFYFDRRDNQFFSIMFMDYMLVEDDFSLNKGASSNYSEETLKVLVDRMKLVEKKDSAILNIPTVQDGDLLRNEIDSFLNLNNIILDTTSIWETEEVSISINVDDDHEIVNEKKEDIIKKKSWWKFW